MNIAETARNLSKALTVAESGSDLELQIIKNALERFAAEVTAELTIREYAKRKQEASQ